MTVRKRKTAGRRNGKRRNGVNELDPEQVFQDLDEVGKELFIISLGTPDRPEDLLSAEEITAEIARRRGGRS